MGTWVNVLKSHLHLVIPVSYLCHYTNLCPDLSQKRTHTHTHTHTHISHSISISVNPPLPPYKHHPHRVFNGVDWISFFSPFKDIHPDSSSKRGGLLQLESGREALWGRGGFESGVYDKTPVLKAAASWLVFRKKKGESETWSTSSASNYSIWKQIKCWNFRSIDMEALHRLFL